MTIKADQLVAAPALRVDRPKIRLKKQIRQTSRIGNPGAQAIRVERKVPGASPEARKEILEIKIVHNAF